MDKFTSFLWKTFYGAFILAFAPGILFILFRSRTFMSPVWLPFITVVIVLPLLLMAWRVCGRVAPLFSDRTHRLLLIGFMAVSAILQFAIGNRLRIVPMWDVEAIFDGAIMWVLTGSLDVPTFYHGTYLRYFAMFSNQWGGVFLFRCVFWVYNLVGGRDFHFAALAWNVGMVQAMVFALHCAARRLYGPRAGLFVLFFLCIFLPFHFFGAVYYTDTLSLPFVAIAFALYLRGKDAEKLITKLLLFAACGLAVAVGAAIKFTVAIVFIAIVIDLLLAEDAGGFLRRLLCAATAALVAVIIFGSFNIYMRGIIGPEMTNRHRIPRAHWLMMGLQGYGRYSWDDFNFTMSIPDLPDRQSQTAAVTRARLGSLGVAGLGRLYAGKFAINFGDGTYEMHRILGQNPVHDTGLHEIVLTRGRHFNSYAHFATGVTTGMLLLMLLAAAGKLLKPQALDINPVPWLAFFGLALVLTFWESGGRLAMNFFPLLVVGGMAGLSMLEPWVDNATLISKEKYSE